MRVTLTRPNAAKRIWGASPGAQATALPSLWPLLMGLGVTTVALGLVTNRSFFIVGWVVIVAATIEWMIQGWSERASASDAYNNDARDTLVDPIELPVAAAAAAGIVVYSFSRIMLGLPSKTSTVIAFGVAALLVVAVGSNYALFFDQKEADSKVTPSTLASMLFANLTTVAGFGLLAFSKVSILQAMGVTVAPGVVLALIYAAIFARLPRA